MLLIVLGCKGISIQANINVTIGIRTSFNISILINMSICKYMNNVNRRNRKLSV